MADRDLTPLVLNPKPNITKVLNGEGEEELFKFLEETYEFGFDLETTPVKDFFWRRLRTMQFGNSYNQYVIDLKSYCDNNADTLYKCQGNYGRDLETVAPKLYILIQKLKKYLCSHKWMKVGVNLSFEYQCMYWLTGLRTFGYYDCMLAEKCIYAGLGGHASLKNYDFFAMDSMVERYFGNTIDKTLQTSFNLDDELTDAQYEYAALDTRTPLGIKMLQTVIASGETTSSLKAKGKNKLADYLYYLDSIILGDNLHEVIELENNALGAFEDMHIHGERMDRERWKARVQKSKDLSVINIKNLDKQFLPIVGSKNDTITKEEIEKLDAEWKSLRDNPTEEEIKLKVELAPLKRQYKKNLEDLDLRMQIDELEIKISQHQQARLTQKEAIKSKCSEMSKRLTKINNLRMDCEGEALINYGSDAQLLKVLCNPDNYLFFPKLFTKKRDGSLAPVLESLDDDTLAEYEATPVIKLIREYHGLGKDIGTYGDAWATEWATKPCKEEGWLHPGDGRLHSTFNQLDAATGRSSSSQPNGQNLPQDKEVRSCFIADETDESVRISDCCDADTFPDPSGPLVCTACACFCETHGEEMVLVTADMSGAELRIIADDSGDTFWIDAFLRDEDLHSVGTELLYGEEWVNLTEPGCAYYKLHTEETVAKNNLCTIGEAQRQKCKCKGHDELRGDNKKVNFLLAYGGGPGKLAADIKKPLSHAKMLMSKHEIKNPGIWAYLKKSGEDAMRNFKAFDLFGRRRLLPQPTTARALDNCKEYNEERLRLDKALADKNIETFIYIKGRKPRKLEEFDLTHRPPTSQEISRSYFQMGNSIGRQGKNHRVQGSNASIIKLAMSCGYAKDGTPFLFHTLPLYKARLVKMVHDELVVSCPKRYADKVAALIGESFAKAAAIKMTKVPMKFDFKISKHWEK
jgi:DNA polymerase I-like protein with 3'-5' exonuclease and polymerase domains